MPPQPLHDHRHRKDAFFNGLLGNTDPQKTETITKPKDTTVHNFRQTYGEPFGWKGRIINGADLNVDVNKDWGPWYVVEDGRVTDRAGHLDHFSIFTNPGVHEEIAWRAAAAYIRRVVSEVQANPGKKPWARRKGEHW